MGQHGESCWLQAQLKTMMMICDSKGKVAPVHSMKAYWGNRGTAPLIHNLDTRWRFLVSFMSQALVLTANLNVLALSEVQWTVYPQSMNSMCKCAQKINQDVMLR